MKISSVALALFSIALSPSGSCAKTTVGTLEGTVMDAHGKAIAGATVTIQTSDGQHPHATHTDAAGQFSFSRFAVGQYDLRAYSHGSYSNWVKRVLIRSHKSTQINLRISIPKV